MSSPASETSQTTGRSILVLATLAIVAGAAAGVVGGAFRWLLIRAAELRTVVAVWAHTVPWGWAVPILAAAGAAAAAAAIVRLSPRAAGSGIQDVEAVVRREADPPPMSVVPARFLGGVLSIGTGMVLGREGPTVHIAAALGAGTGRTARLGDEDARALQTSMAGAGLAVAFNAPIGGALFVLEEVTKSARLRFLAPTLAGVAVAVAFARLILGDHPDFAVGEVPVPSAATLPLFVLFGVLVGVVGVGYNVVVLRLLRFTDGLRRVPAIARAGLIGGVVGLLFFLDPRFVGGGDDLTQALLAGQALALPVLVLYLVVRFFTGPLSYAAATPGGLFAPLLALGALLGSGTTILVDAVLPGLPPGFALAMVIVGMSTLFAAVVRAPLTGIALTVEMTAITTVTVPMLLAGVAAVMTATLLRSAPVYDSLRERMIGTGAR